MPITSYSFNTNLWKNYYRGDDSLIYNTGHSNRTIIRIDDTGATGISTLDFIKNHPDLANILPSFLFRDNERINSGNEEFNTGVFTSISPTYYAFQYKNVLYTYNFTSSKVAKDTLTDLYVPSMGVNNFYPQLFSHYYVYNSISKESLLYFYDLETKKYTSIDLSLIDTGYNGYFTHLIDHDSALTITTVSKCFISINKNLEVIDTFFYTGEAKNVNSIVDDQYGNYWISTTGEGTYILSKYVHPFEKISFDFNTGTILSIFQDNEHYFLFDNNSQLYITDNSFRLIRKISLPIVYKSYPQISKYWFYPDGNNGYYIASAFGSYYLYNDLKSIKTFKGSNFQVSFKDYFLDGDSLIISSSGGIFCVNKNASSLTRQSITIAPRLLHIDRIPNGYFGTNDFGEIFIIPKDLASQKRMSAKGTILFSTYDNGNYIVALEGDGIYSYSSKYKTLTKIIDDDNFHYYTKGNNGFWVANEHYIAKIIHKGEKYIIGHKYLNLNRLLYNEVYNINENDNATFLVGDHGVVQLPDNNFTYYDTNFINSAYLSSITIGQNSSYYFDKIDSTISFPFSHENIAFQLTCNSISFLGNVQYEYYIENENSEWVISKDGAINYPALSPGSYTMHIRAKADHLSLYTKEKVFVINIIPKWWQSLVFKLALATIILILLGYLIQLRIAKIKKREKKQTELDKKISELELNALQSQMNPHFIFNSLTSIQSFINSNKRDDANNLLHKFSLLVRMYLDFSRSKLITLDQEIKSLQIYTDIEQMRFGNKFKIAFEVRNPREKNLNDLLIPPMLIQPLVENAINHGLYHLKSNNGVLRLYFLINNNEIQIVIDDNGIGRANAKKLRNKLFPSIGNQLISDRIEILNASGRADIQMEIIDKQSKEGLPEGTRVILIIKNITTYDKGDNN